MKFFQGIQIVDKEKNIDCELLNLGRINILCGKNNAGKTTLLKAIEAKQLIAKTTLSDKEINELKNEADKFTLTNLSDKFKSFEGKEQFLENYSKYKDEIFVDLKNMSESTRLEIKSLEDKVYSYQVGQIRDFFVGVDDIIHAQDIKKKTIWTLLPLLHPNPNIKYIDAKRRINITDNPNINITVEEQFKYLEEDMKELTRYLYHCKSESKHSNESILYEKIQSSFYEITKGWSFDISSVKEQKGFVGLDFLYNHSFPVLAKDVGFGLQDILTTLVFALIPKYDIVLIEEPENHLHPEMQRELLRFLSQQTDKQFFISTHSSVFLDMSYVDKIYTVFYDDKINVRESTDKADALSELGYLSSDNLLSDIIILTEGKTDIPVLEEFLREYDLFEEYDIKFLALGGVTSLDSAKYDSLIENYSRIIIVTDGDNNRESKQAVKGIKEKIADIEKITHCELEGYGIENYLNPNTIKVYYGENSEFTLGDGFEECLSEDMNLFKIEKNVKGFRKDEKSHRVIASRMTKEDIEKAHDICKNFIEKVKEVCESLPKKN